MQDELAKLHTKTYDVLADEYEERVEALKPITEHALSYLIRDLKKGSKILDVGCAVGYTLEILSKAGMHPEGIDISPSMTKYARKRNSDCKIVTGDFMTEHYSAHSFDAVLLYAFIHLFPYDMAINCLDKIVSILKPGGYIFFSTTKSAVSSEGFENKHDYKTSVQRFRKRWTRKELEDTLRTYNLEVIHKVDIKDEFGKVWMDYVARKPL